ncbi:golgin subfamily A member 6-like protein 22 [Cloeon dipterum]|uniref:golgin subfamily A member 6-like protein 22 n=1 Tax=Cloeon dipterum TaxID=197152 RepID=UPI0032203871
MEEETGSLQPEEDQPEAEEETPEPESEIPESADEIPESQEEILESKSENAEPKPENAEFEPEERDNSAEEEPQSAEPEQTEAENSIDDSDLLQMIEEAKQDLLESPLEGSTGREGEGEEEEEEEADKSSSPSEVGPSANKEKRLSKHRNQGQEDNSDDSARSLTPEEAALPPLGPRTPPPTTQGETQTDWRQSGVEVVSLPLLREMKRVQGEPGERWEEKVLGTEVTARFKEPMPTVVLPLDRFYPMDSPLASACGGRLTGRGSNLEVVSTYTTHTANNVVDAQVTYRDDKRGGVRVDIDGGGLQVILDVEQKKKRKRKANKWERRMKREPLSLRPPKPKFNRCPDLLRKLAWLEDKAEERHVLRMQVSRDAKHWKPTLPQRAVPDFGPRWKDWHAMPYPEEPPTKDVGRTLVSTNQHVGLMMYARHLEGKRRQARKLAPQPCSLPPATELRPGVRPASVYEDERIKRLREAREHYARVSMGTLPPLPLEERDEMGGEDMESTIELLLPDILEDTVEEVEEDGGEELELQVEGKEEIIPEAQEEGDVEEEGEGEVEEEKEEGIEIEEGGEVAQVEEENIKLEEEEGEDDQKEEVGQGEEEIDQEEGEEIQEEEQIEENAEEGEEEPGVEEIEKEGEEEQAAENEAEEEAA